MKSTLYIIPLLLLLAACRTARTTERAIRADTIYISNGTHDTLHQLITTHDTLILRDSTAYSERQLGDTIFITSYRDRVTYRDRLRTDTVYRTRIQYDTLYHTARDTLTQTITQKPSLWHKTRETASLVLFLLLTLYVTTKLFEWRRRKNNEK